MIRYPNLLVCVLQEISQQVRDIRLQKALSEHFGAGISNKWANLVNNLIITCLAAHINSIKF